MTEEIKSFTKNDRLQVDETMAFFSKRVIVSDEENEYRSYRGIARKPLSLAGG